jgi:hypothetical protein
MLVKYQIGVDILNFPVYCEHFITVEIIKNNKL